MLAFFLTGNVINEKFSDTFLCIFIHSVWVTDLFAYSHIHLRWLKIECTIQEISFVQFVSTSPQNGCSPNSDTALDLIHGSHPMHLRQFTLIWLKAKQCTLLSEVLMDRKVIVRMGSRPVCSWELKKRYFSQNFVLNNPMWHVPLNHACLSAKLNVLL